MQLGGGEGGGGGAVTVTTADCCAPPPKAVAVTVALPTPSAMTAPIVAEATRVESTFGLDDCHVNEIPGIGSPAASKACAVNMRPPFMEIVALAGETVADATAGSALTSNRSY